MLLNARGAIIDSKGKVLLISTNALGCDTVTYYVHEDKVTAIPAMTSLAWDGVHIRDPSQSLEIEPPSPVVNIAERLSEAEARDDISEMVFSPGSSRQPAPIRVDDFELINMSVFSGVLV